jgi:hypothetical protein
MGAVSFGDLQRHDHSAYDGKSLRASRGKCQREEKWILQKEQLRAIHGLWALSKAHVIIIISTLQCTQYTYRIVPVPSKQAVATILKGSE